MPDIPDKDHLVAFGRRVANLRRRTGLSQEQLASRCGLHRTYVGGVERGERNVGLLNIRRLAEGLGVSAAALLTEWGQTSHPYDPSSGFGADDRSGVAPPHSP